MVQQFIARTYRIAMCIELDEGVTRVATEAARDLSAEDYDVIVAWLKREILKKVVEAMTPELFHSNSGRVRNQARTDD